MEEERREESSEEEEQKPSFFIRQKNRGRFVKSSVHDYFNKVESPPGSEDLKEAKKIIDNITVTKPQRGVWLYSFGTARIPYRRFMRAHV